MLRSLRAGRPALMVNIAMGTMPMAVELAGRTGIEGAWLDMEHRPYTPHEVAEMCAAARLGDIDAVVRIRKGEGYTSVFRPLEDGAAGIIVPHVTTREEAQWIVRHAKFPPQGARGIEIVCPDADLGMADPKTYLAHANRETFVAIQIEDAEALERLDEILSVPGIDVIFIGPADLTASLGVPFEFTAARYLEAVQRIADAAKRHGKWWGLPVRDVAAAAAFAAQGARVFNIGSDYGALKRTWLTLRQDFDRQFPPTA